jgi:hypothetical protein
LLPCVEIAATKETKAKNRPNSGNLMVKKCGVVNGRRAHLPELSCLRVVKLLRTQNNLPKICRPLEICGVGDDRQPHLLTCLTSPRQPSQPPHIPLNTMAPVSFWGGPITYFQWAARHKPAIFWSFVVGSMGPVAVVRLPRVQPSAS